MRAFVVAVDYADLLAVTLPYNAHHFEDVHVVTDAASEAAVRPVVRSVPNADMMVTDAFYRGGADFNKWAALEELLDRAGRSGWIALLDADVLWPKETLLDVGTDRRGFHICPGFLYGALRRMYPRVPRTAAELPPEDQWGRYPLHRNVHEWAGYTQVFHGSDPVLGPAPWHDVSWRHAGGADTFFQAKWPRERRVRFPWEVLHLGPAGANWCGRVSRYADGRVPERASDRAGRLGGYMLQRRRPEGRDFRHEKLT